jgi:acetyl-CoA carboxylase carboxyltransferase component
MADDISQAKPARLTLYEHVERLVDSGSYAPAAPAAGETVPAGGEALIDGRPVTVGYSGHVLERALARRHPYVGLSSGTGGLARGGPRNLGVLDPIWGMSGGPMLLEMCRRDRVVPVVSAVVRHSFGDSSFFTGLSDFVIQLRGTSMALTGPRVLAIGTSERVTMEELGGVDVHRRNGQADVIAETLDEAYTAIRRILSFLPSCAGAPLPVRDPGAPAGLMNPGQPMRQLIDGLCDPRSFFELKRDFAPSLITGLARLDGYPVGVVASEPARDGGAWSGDACLKVTRLVSNCDAFGLPVVFLMDSPGPREDHPAAVSRAMMLAQAVQLAEVPKCWVVTGQARGTGLLITGSARVATDLVVAWPGARVGYHDDPAPPADLGPSVDPGPPAGLGPWAPDGVVAPADTRRVLAAHLRAVLGPAPVSRPGKVLRSWPAGF